MFVGVCCNHSLEFVHKSKLNCNLALLAVHSGVLTVLYEALISHFALQCNIAALLSLQINLFLCVCVCICVYIWVLVCFLRLSLLVVVMDSLLWPSIRVSMLSLPLKFAVAAAAK